jgi:succinate dehydrogenase/fumarate reductase cytochrome b subunit
VLLAGLLFHGLNGIRVALVGSGVAPNRQRALFWAAAVIGTAALVYGAVHVLGAG